MGDKLAAFYEVLHFQKLLCGLCILSCVTLRVHLSGYVSVCASVQLCIPIREINPLAPTEPTPSPSLLPLIPSAVTNSAPDAATTSHMCTCVCLHIYITYRSISRFILLTTEPTAQLTMHHSTQHTCQLSHTAMINHFIIVMHNVNRCLAVKSAGGSESLFSPLN